MRFTSEPEAILAIARQIIALRLHHNGEVNYGSIWHLNLYDGWSYDRYDALTGRAVYVADVRLGGVDLQKSVDQAEAWLEQSRPNTKA